VRIRDCMHRCIILVIEKNARNQPPKHTFKQFFLDEVFGE